MFVSIRKAVLVCSASVFLASACHHKPPVPPAPPPTPPAPVPTRGNPPPPPPQPPTPQPVPPTPPAQPTAEEIFARMTLQQLNEQKPLDDVFFEYDKADLSEKARTSLQKDADWMKRWTTTRVTVEGHADSRGTNEYNLALGERRSAATRDYLVTLGVPANRIDIVSKGEEQPFCTEEAESCWSLNRRGHFIITAK
jgi:peptidoglycan-associated lipoprotein